MKLKNAKRWKLGHRAVMRDCYGRKRWEGQVVERGTYEVTLWLPDGTILHGSTSLMEPPTGEKWEGEHPTLFKDKPGSWDRMEARCIRLGLPIPEFKPWLKGGGLEGKARKRKKRST